MAKTAFIFAGQGAQKAGMGKDLYDNYKIVKHTFDNASDILGIDMKSLCFEGEGLDLTENTQPAVYTFGVAVLNMMAELGIKPDFCGGLSLGEYAALTAGGVLDFEDGVKLVRKRGLLMEKAVPAGIGSLAAVIGLDADVVALVVEEASSAGRIYISNYNCPGQIVIGGETTALEAACAIAEQKGARMAKMLNVSGPFHTPMLKDAGVKLGFELENVEMGEFKIPVWSNVLGCEYPSSDDVKDLLIKQVYSPVKWQNCISDMIDKGADTFVELGPGRVLSSFVKKIDRKKTIVNIEDIKSLEKAMVKL